MTDTASLRLNSAALTDVGLKRQNNEDAYLADAALGVYAVADGMGGHAGGEVASAMAIEALRQAIAQAPDAQFLRHPSLANRRLLLDWLAKTVQSINDAMQARTQEEPDLHGMGCTLDVALVRGGGVFIAHVGDSRVYVLRAGGLYQLTEDHSFGHMMLAKGVLTAAEIAKHPQRGVLTRAIGPFPTVEVDTVFFELDAGDVFLLCSDGLYNEVGEDKLQQLVAQPPETAVKELIQAAIDGGGRDNATAVLIQVIESPLQYQGIIGAETTRRALAGSSLFCTCSEIELMRVQKIALGRIVQPDEVVLTQGDAVADLYLVMEGALGLIRDGERIGHLKAGDPFGAMALIPEPATEFTVRAEAPTRLLVFPLAEVKTLLASDTAIAAKLALAALERVHHRFQSLVESYSQHRRDTAAKVAVPDPDLSAEHPPNG